MKHKLLILCPGRQTYLITSFQKYFEVYIGDSGQTTISTYHNLPSIKLPSYYSDEYMNALIEYIRKNRIEYILTLSDIEVVVLTKNEVLLENLGCKLIALPYDMAYACLDKYVFSKVLIHNGIATPKTYINPKEVINDLNEGKLSLPIIVKNRFGMGSKGLNILRSREELLNCISNSSTIEMPSFLGEIQEPNYSLVFQEMIPGQEYGIDIVNNLNRQYYTHIIKKKIEMRGGETDIAQLTELSEANNLATQISLIFSHIGNLDCDFIYNGNQCYVIDINPRFGGGYIFSTYAGLNIPELLYKWLNNQKINAFSPENIGKKYRKVTKLVEIQ